MSLDVTTLEEDQIREWFMRVDMGQAEDTARAVQVIIETRRATQPKRKRRKDAGKPKTIQGQSMTMPLLSGDQPK